MFDRILVPLDGSEHAERISGWVMGLAMSIDAEAELLTVIDPARLTLPKASPEASARHPEIESPAPGTGPDDAPRETEPMAPHARAPSDALPTTIAGWEVQEAPPAFGTQIVDSVVQRAQRYLHDRALMFEEFGVKATTNVAVGNPAEEIVKRAASPEVDMIAMATRRESALARGILGSVTDRVLHNTPVPLLTIRPADAQNTLAKAGRPGIIVVPLDGSGLSEAAVPVSLFLAKATGAEVLFLQALPPPYVAAGELGVQFYTSDYGISEEREEVFRYLSAFVERASKEGVEATARAAVGGAAECIVEAVENQPGGLVVMGTHGASGFKRWVVGSVTDKVIRSSGHPVLVLPPRDAAG